MPVSFIFSIIFLFLTLIGLVAAYLANRIYKTQVEDERRIGTPDNFAVGWAGGAAVTFIVFLVFLFVAAFDKVEEYEVGIPVSFGSAQESVGPGIDWHAPWVKMERQDTRVQEIEFKGKNAIEAQALGGGSLNLDLRIQWRIPVSGAVEIYRNIGSDRDKIEKVVIIPAARECPRNATIRFTPEGAFTTDREEIRDLTLECIRNEVKPFGIEIPDVFLGDVDPGAKVRAEIDTKVATQQQINRAAEELDLQEIELQKEEVVARQAAVEAFGVSQAEQIVSCGGVPQFNEEGSVTNVTPNTTCDEQFPDDYLTWLFINQLDKVDGLTIVAPGLDASLLLPAGGAKLGE